MDEGRAYEAEFEAAGEVEVNDRVATGRYTGAARAYAVRWLNDREMARLTGAAFLAAPVAAELAALARNSRRAARWAVISASVAGFVTIANISYAAYSQIQQNDQAKHKKTPHAVVHAAPRPEAPAAIVAPRAGKGVAAATAATPSGDNQKN